MAQTPKLCCPTPTLKSPLHPHPIPTSGNSVTSANTDLVKLCTPDGDPVLVQFDTSTIPPQALSAITASGERYEGDLAELMECEVTLEGQDCAGEALPATAKAGELVQIVQAPGQVLSVRFCDDAASRDWELIKRCSPGGEEILFQWDVKTNPPTLVSATNLATGEAYTGDGTELISCGSTQIWQAARTPSPTKQAWSAANVFPPAPP
jgi:hypothetical protein